MEHEKDSPKPVTEEVDSSLSYLNADAIMTGDDGFCSSSPPRMTFLNDHFRRSDFRSIMSAAEEEAMLLRQAIRASYNIPAGLQLIEVADDGNCLYQAFADSLSDVLKPTPIALRNQVADYIEKNRAQYEGTIQALLATGLSAQTVEEYVQGIRRGSWGCELEATVLGFCYEKFVVIIGPDGKIKNGFDVVNRDLSHSIFILHDDQGHYEGLQVIPGYNRDLILEAISQETEQRLRFN